MKSLLKAEHVVVSDTKVDATIDTHTEQTAKGVDPFLIGGIVGGIVALVILVVVVGMIIKAGKK